MTRYMFISLNWWTDLKLSDIITCSYRIISIFVMRNKICMEKILVEDINFGEYKIYRSNGYLGLFDSEGNQLLPFLYDAFEYDKGIIQSTIIVVQNGKKGVFYLSNHGGKPSRVLIPAFYDTITKEQVPVMRYRYNPYLFYCYRDTVVDVWDEDGAMIYSDVLDEVLFSVVSNSDVIYLGVKKQGKCGIVSSTLRQLALPCEFDEVSGPIEGPGERVLFDVSKNGLWGVVEIKQSHPYYKAVLPIEYEELHTVGEYIVVKINGHYGVRNHEENLTGCEYNTFDCYVDSCYTDDGDSPIYITLLKGQDCYLYQEDGLIKVPGKLKEIYSDKCLVYEKNGYLGIADYKGNILVKNQYTNIKHLTDNDVCLGEVFEPSTFLLEKNGKRGMFSLTFGTQLPCNFDQIFKVDYNMYCAKTRNSFSLYDYKFSCVIPFGYERYKKFEFSCDDTMSIYTFYKVYLQGKVGVYSDSDQCVPCTYDDVDIIDLSDSYTIDWLNGDEPNYKFWFVVTNNNKKGLINEIGIVIIPCVCDEIKLSDEIDVRYKGNRYSGITLSQLEEIISENQ